MKAKINSPFRGHKSLNILLVLSILLLSNDIFAQAKVVGYFTHYRRNIYPADSIQIGNVSHINHAFAWANADGSIYTPNGFLYPVLNTKVHNAGKKILLCFGSDGISTFANFGNVLANSTLRATFITNITKYLIANNYDGADFDWESPTCSTDRTNYLLFISALRTAFNAANPKLLITMAVTADDYNGQWCDYTSMTQYIDWYNMMGYDLHGSWISHTGYNAPLYLGTDTHGCGSLDEGVKYLTVTRGIPKNKIVLGVPFYGYEYTGSTGFLSSYSTVTQLPYSQILAEINTGGFVYHWDSGSSVPYYFNSSSKKFISLDDTTSIHAKVNYSIAQGLGGVMIWELDNDMVAGHQPLLEVIGKTLSMSPPATNLPAKVKLIAPVNIALNQQAQLTLSWNKAPYAQKYLVQLAKDINFTNLIVNDNNITDTTKSITSLSNSTIYYWRVQGINQYGSGTVSDIFTFTTIAAITVPVKPSPIAPILNAANQPLSLELKWTKVSGAQSYLVQLSRNSSFSSLDIADSSLTDTVKQISSLLNNANYYWRVRVKNYAGIGAWSNTYSFITIALVTDKPVLIYPYNLQIKLPVQVSFKWIKTKNSNSYWVEVATDNLFSQLVINDNKITDTTKLEMLKNSNTRYYWRVAAINNTGTSSWSDTWSFTTTFSSPYHLSATLDQSREIILKWQDSVSTLTEYKIERKSLPDTNFTVIDSIKATQTFYIDKMVNIGIVYEYRIKGVSDLSESDYSNEVSISTTGIKNESVPYAYELMQNYPNPFNPQTIITYQLPSISKVRIIVFDMLGREVKTLVDDEKPAGKYQIIWNATDNYGKKVTSGVYIYSLKTNGYSQTRKMILMK